MRFENHWSMNRRSSGAPAWRPTAPLKEIVGRSSALRAPTLRRAASTRSNAAITSGRSSRSDTGSPPGIGVVSTAGSSAAGSRSSIVPAYRPTRRARRPSASSTAVRRPGRFDSAVRYCCRIA